MSFITKGNFSSLECTLIVLINIHMYFGVNLNTKSMKWMCLEFTSKLIKIRQIWMNYALPRNFTSFDTRPLPLSLPHPQTINIDSILSVIGQHNYSIMDYRILTDLFHTVVNRKLCYIEFLIIVFLVEWYPFITQWRVQFRSTAKSIFNLSLKSDVIDNTFFSKTNIDPHLYIYISSNTVYWYIVRIRPFVNFQLLVKSQCFIKCSVQW